MKHVLVFSHAMELGGAEKALLGLLGSFDTTEYGVDLFLMRHCGELLPFVPEDVHLLPERRGYSSLAVPIKDVLFRGEISVAIGRLAGKLAAKRMA